MERRLSKRYLVFFDAVINSGSTRYEGVIGNISETGIYMRIKHVNDRITFTPGTIFDLKMKLKTDETLDLRCRLVYAYEIPLVTSGGNFAYNLGMEIIEPSPGYSDLYLNVAMKKLNDQLKSFS